MTRLRARPDDEVDCVDPGKRGVLDSIRSMLNDTTLTEETDVERSEQLIKEFVCRTRSSLRMSTSLPETVYGDGQIRDSVRAVAANGEVRLLLDRSVDLDAKREAFGWVFDDENIDLRQATTDVPHWLISDERNIRLEKEHADGAVGGPNLFIENADPAVRDIYISKFDKWWRNESRIVDRVTPRPAD